MERNIIRQRVKERIAAARARGRKGGRPRMMTILMSVCGILTIILAIAAIWYFVKSLILLGRNNVLLGIAGLFFLAIDSNYFLFSRKKKITDKEQRSAYTFSLDEVCRCYLWYFNRYFFRAYAKTINFCVNCF